MCHPAPQGVLTATWRGPHREEPAASPTGEGVPNSYHPVLLGSELLTGCRGLASTREAGGSTSEGRLLSDPRPAALGLPGPSPCHPNDGASVPTAVSSPVPTGLVEPLTRLGRAVPSRALSRAAGLPRAL